MGSISLNMVRLLLATVILAGVILHNDFAVAEDSLNSDSELPLSDKSFTKTKRSLKLFKKISPKKLKYPGGCVTIPDSPINGNISCSFLSGCQATCAEGYRFPSGEHELVLTCQNKAWKLQKTDYNAVPHCEPICLPECKNNGICVAPNQCNCTENFSGSQCQFENKPCYNPPPTSKNAQRKCNSKTCTITCLKHFVFPDGSSVANLMCKHGNWEPTRNDWVTVPDCQPVCNPPCQNGGICLSLDTCQCPKDFRGPQCQYHEDACSLDKLGFNGIYQCNSQDENTYACILTCPADVEFEFPPAASYVCNYATGTFEPQPIPRCLPPASAQLVSSYQSISFYHTSNQTWTSVQEIVGHQEMIDSNTHYNSKLVEHKKPVPGTCITWAGTHYKTFDGQIYSFESNCTYTLLKDSKDGLFTITVQNDPNCQKNLLRCPRLVRIFVQGKEYALVSNEIGLPEFRVGIKGKALPVPSQLIHVRVESVVGNQLIVSLDAVGLKIKWDGANLVQLDASKSLWNRTAGLCGNMNGERTDNFKGQNVLHMVGRWKVDDIGEKCEEYSTHQHKCGSNVELETEADKFCMQLLSDLRYKQCAELVDLVEIQSACRWDYCSCSEVDRRKCACDTMSVYVRQCAQKGIVSLAGWRNSSLCPMECTEGKVYSACGPKSQPICGGDFSTSESKPLVEELNPNCDEGCFCPAGSVLHEDRCIAPTECPCRLRGKSFAPGATVPKDCNTCICATGRWICTESKCNARCSAVGDPHYTTFDGKHYNFMGHCSYYLMKADNYSIEAENTACVSALSEIMGFTRTYQDGEPSCTKTVTIRLNDVAIKLKQNRQILVNGEGLTKLPTVAGGAKLRIVSSIFVSVKLPNGIEVMWDGVSRVYVTAPAHLRGATNGLCGTFTLSQKDDFLTPDGDVEQSVVAFANKWKTSEQCADVKKDFEHPCDRNPQKREAAEKYCAVLKKKTFSDYCHWHVDPEPFYKDCIYDMCACEANIETCLCPILSGYAKDCSQVGVIIPWREEVPECQIHCPGDQEYQMCGNSCTRSCVDISFNSECKEECVEGCNCPKGQTLNVNGECIPIGQCSCTYSGLEFLAGYREVRPGTKGQEICTCAGGLWNCQLATKDEIRDYPPVDQLRSFCSPIKHQELTTCEPAEQRTCRNMHRLVDHSPAVCRPGCVCKPGYVLDRPSGECVREQDCPCYHGGQSFKEGSVMQEECNTCSCRAGKWNCTDIICPGVCSVWGDSHYKSFDDREFDFQGACDYVLAKGKLSDTESFEVTIRNVACGTTGVTCSKSITLTVGKSNTAQQESIKLTRGRSLTAESFKGLERITARHAGLFTFLDVPDLGLVLQWDEGTRVYLRLEAKWKGHTRGLCGDFDDNASNDFETPSGGIPETSASLFADSWKINKLCAEPQEHQPDTCAKHPERQLWATQSCRVIKSALFKPCHSEVIPDGYLERCIYDACGCDDGGDCECLCTAIAAYAHECNARGVPIHWRSQKLCPMQCDETCSNYSPCLSTCPRESCDNLVTRSDAMHMCDQDTCVDGCQPKACPEGEIYLNASHGECVPRAMCKTLCLLIDGVKFYEGDWVRGDNCHQCFCSRGKVICNGPPCHRIDPLNNSTTVPPSLQEETKKCISGWTKWFNRDVPKEPGFRSDIEELPTLIEMLSDEKSAVCDHSKMINIQCRTAATNQSYKEVGLNVDCSLEKGLICEPSKAENVNCPDFEISVFCSCEDVSTTTTTPSNIDECNLNDLKRSTPENCFEFLQCVSSAIGNVWVRKVCDPDKMFNEKLQICDWPTNVVVVRPECESPSKTGNECILNEPYRSVPENCVDFLQCGPGLTGNVWVRKTCDHAMMFNEKLQICDWPEGVAKIRPDCGGIDEYVSFTHVPKSESGFVTKNKCEEGQHWDDCAIRCEKTCEYYNHELIQKRVCHTSAHCVAGCVPNDRDNCVGDNRYWRDQYTCVDKSHCTCTSDKGQPLKPGEIVKVSECETCQCINNYYTCDKSSCETNELDWQERKNVTVFKKEEMDRFILNSPVSPPGDCDPSDYMWLTEKAPFDVTFNASSFESASVPAESIRLRRVNSMTTWRPEHDDNNQWIEVRLKRSQPIYGIIVGGDPFENKFVTSYTILFSDGEHSYSYIMDENGEPKVHRGPVDPANPVRQIFKPPIEATVVKVSPVTWHKGIAMQVELVGCEETKTTTPPMIITTPVITESVISPVCDDRMGYDGQIMADQQVSVSSSALNTIIPNVRLSSIEIWRPALDNLDQYVQFDFLEARNLTGIETKGGNGIWTTAYKVYYSHDGKNWNSVTDEDSGSVKEFLGNFDDYSSKINYFKKTIGARLLRIFPTKWHQHIGMKVEIHGCYLPYPNLPPIVPLSSSQSSCNVCTGVVIKNEDNCKCERSLWWDGHFCVTKMECPCVVGHVTYPVGSSYETTDCNRCLCTLGGLSVCQPKNCESCSNPLERPVLTELCACLCKPCPARKRLCPTSNDCIDESLWCNGVQDCPDDETGCLRTIESSNTTIVKELIINIKCQSSCPPGYIMEPVTVLESYGTGLHEHSMEKTVSINMSYTKKVSKIKIPPPAVKVQSRFSDEPEEENTCPKFICRTLIDNSEKVKTCPKIECPPNFQPKFDQSKSYHKNSVCDNTCIPIPPKERVCNFVGKSFSTFDDFRYKYSICNHILARDRYGNEWFVVAEKVCKGDQSLSCLNTVVVTFGDHIVQLHPDMYAIIDGNTYSESEVKHFGDKHPAMKLSRVGNALRLESKRYPFWVLLESDDNSIKVGVSEELSEKVDGMCGFLDGLLSNDLMTPDGHQVKSSQVFGDSWKVQDSTECKLQECPAEQRKETWKMCNLVKEATFEACSEKIDRDKFISECLESSCACLSSANVTSQECRCRALSSFVTSCLAADKNVELSTWRSVYDCPAVCKAPFIHKDCFRNKCEMSCENLQEANPCPVMDGICVPGCFCPDGLVRYGDTCLSPSECRDCMCDGLGDSKYITFDRLNLPFDGNCTYVLSRDVVAEEFNKEHAYQVGFIHYVVLVSNGACNEGTCTEAITVLYQSHLVQIRKGTQANQLISFVDAQRIDVFPYRTPWLDLEETPNRDVKLLIPAIQLEITCYRQNLAFMLRIPSHTFGGAMEGLCGDCNNNQKDDLRQRGRLITNDTQDFGNSWLTKDLPAELNLDNEEYCTSKPKKSCADQPSVNNYCERLIEDESFVRCHGIINPMPYYFACKDSLCAADHACSNFEAYARMCTSQGICVDWRDAELCPYHCPQHLEYKACGSGCTETCETIGSNVKCTASPAEGCFCPVGHVLHNDTCVAQRDCFVCDIEGHVEGDVWRPNKCTECTCQRPNLIKCQEISCSAQETVCEENSRAIVVIGTEDDCCPKYTCVPISTNFSTCPEAIKPECGFGQNLKTTIDANGCQKFICQCVPPIDCPIDIDIRLKKQKLEPGYVIEMDEMGCCPRMKVVCKPELCPEPAKCKEHFKPVVKEIVNSCCKEIECEAPKDMCIYYFDESNDFNFQLNSVVKNIGESWNDGKCKTCICEQQDGLPIAKCTSKDCLSILNHPDIYDFALEEVPRDNQCCPDFKRVACKHADRIYRVGATWQPDPNDMCVVATCSLDYNTVLMKSTIVQKCTESCELGYEYQPPYNRSVTCCGECVPVACVVDGELKNAGQTWYSEDLCTASTCVMDNGVFNVHLSRETCETIDPMEEQDYKIEKRTLPGKCCPNFTRTACLSNGKYYYPGETWKSVLDSCVVESCIQAVDGKVVKQKKTQSCNMDCPKGWEYQRPINGTCCGECKQVYCIWNEYLYEPGKVWYSVDNCTTYSCTQTKDQLLISTSSETCPELNCAPEYIYDDGCCKKCNPFVGNQYGKQDCAIEVVDFKQTIGIVVEEKGVHGICKNLNPIEGLTECHGHCYSYTSFDTSTWNQVINCKCCQPVDYMKIFVEMMCDDGTRFKKTLTVPKSCSCERCSDILVREDKTPGILKPLKNVKKFFEKYKEKSKK